MKPLVYLHNVLKDLPTNFMADWKSISDEDKADLKQWATQEMEYLGIEVS